MLRLCRSLYFLKTFRRHTKYTSNVGTLFLKIHCTVVVSLRSHISVVSQTLERRSVLVTSLTNVNAHSSVRVGMPTLSLFCWESTVTKSFMPLLKQCHWNTGTRRWIHVLFGLNWNFPDLYGKLKKTYCSAQNCGVRIFSDISFIVSYNKISSH